MEIMIVIIVIAVLASVAGPMIGNITDQGRASATKSKMSNLKSALIAFQGDVGRFPYKGKDVKDGKSFDQIGLLNSYDEANNVLVCNANIMSLKNYNRKWKGPYMDSDPSDFMWDSWGNQILYVREGKNLYLWSFGPDGLACGSAFSCVEDAYKAQGSPDSTIDDIVISVSKFKQSITDGSGRTDTTILSDTDDSGD